KQAVMGMCHQQVAHGIILAGGHARDAAPSAPLSTIGIGREALDIAFLCQGHNDLFVFNQIFFAKFAGLSANDLGATCIAVFFFEIFEVSSNKFANLINVAEE